MGNLRAFHKEKQGKALESVSCCICGGPGSSYAVDYNGNSITRCGNCGLRFVSPRASLSSIVEHVYEPGYYAPKSPEKETVENARFLAERIRERIRSHGLALDVGAGEGLLMAALRRHGWEVEGTEIVPEQVETLKKKLSCRVHLGQIEELAIHNLFNLVTCIHVLEHTPEPRGFLKACMRMLKPGGFLYAVFPNTDSLNDRIKSFLSRWRLKSRPWKHLAADHHLWFFTLPTARALAAVTGFDLLSISIIFPYNKQKSAVARPFLGLSGRTGLGVWIEMVLRRPTT